MIRKEPIQLKSLHVITSNHLLYWVAHREHDPLLSNPQEQAFSQMMKRPVHKSSMHPNHYTLPSY